MLIQRSRTHENTIIYGFASRYFRVRPSFLRRGGQRRYRNDVIKEALVKHRKITGDFTIAVAKIMPADDYGFRPAPEELSFAQLMIQISGANLSGCANASGMTHPAIPPKIAQAVRDEKIDVDKEGRSQIYARFV